ncbi:MAG: T9SS type A sorting domain-containing protein [bacterium]|nr:T9SS type A sorting domain-containing protein [bacterium]
MKNLLLFSLLFLGLLFFSGLNPLLAQTVNAAKVCDLPAELSETSGLIKIGPNKFVSHNDSGNEPILFVFDSSGLIQRRIKISNAQNVDWEDLTMDSKGNVYIGDFGNNNSDRTNLRIYVVASPNTYTKDSTIAGITNFTYSDQKAFPPAVAYQNFDMESFFWFNDSLYLFSKNRTNPYSGYTKCYRLPARSGTFVAQLIDSFYTGSGGYLNYSVTGGAAFANGNKIALLGYDKVWLFSGFNGNRFFKGTANTLAFPNLSQKEALWFENTNTLWYTQETSALGTAGLFRFNLPNLTPSGLIELQKKYYKIYPNPAEHILCVEVHDDIAEPAMLLDILNLEGRLVLKDEIEPQVINKLNISNLAKGKYFVRINGILAGSFLK